MSHMSHICPFHPCQVHQEFYIGTAYTDDHVFHRAFRWFMLCRHSIFFHFHGILRVYLNRGVCLLGKYMKIMKFSAENLKHGPLATAVWCSREGTISARLGMILGLGSILQISRLNRWQILIRYKLITTVHIFYRQLGCLAFSLRFWPKIKQLLSNCPASDLTFSSANFH